jgi:hypothetical protein
VGGRLNNKEYDSSQIAAVSAARLLASAEEGEIGWVGAFIKGSRLGFLGWRIYIAYDVLSTFKDLEEFFVCLFVLGRDDVGEIGEMEGMVGLRLNGAVSVVAIVGVKWLCVEITFSGMESGVGLGWR